MNLDWGEEPATAEDLASLREPPDPEEVEHILALHRWFVRRYSPLERLRYVARDRWVRMREERRRSSGG